MIVLDSVIIVYMESRKSVAETLYCLLCIKCSKCKMSRIEAEAEKLFSRDAVEIINLFAGFFNIRAYAAVYLLCRIIELPEIFETAGNFIFSELRNKCRVQRNIHFPLSSA